MKTLLFALVIAMAFAFNAISQTPETTTKAVAEQTVKNAAQSKTKVIKAARIEAAKAVETARAEANASEANASEAVAEKDKKCIKTKATKAVAKQAIKEIEKNRICQKISLPLQAETPSGILPVFINAST